MTARRLFSPPRLIAVALLLSLLIGACSSGSNDSAGTDGGVTTDDFGLAEPASEPQRLASGDSGATGSGAGGSGFDEDSTVSISIGSEGLAPIGPSVIKTGSLSVRVAKDGLRDAINDSIAMAGRFGGIVVSSSISESRADRADLTIRVPADRFEAAMAELAGLGDVKNESITGEDVSQEFVDLEARLRNASSQEAVLLRLMDQSKTISDTIKVQRELTGLQLEIEQIKGRLRFLDDQTAMSTIFVSLGEKGAPPAAKKNPIQRAWATAIDTVVAMGSAIIVGAGVVIPLGLLLALAWLASRPIRKRMRDRGPFADAPTA